jgi:hypothetical protein
MRKAVAGGVPRGYTLLFNSRKRGQILRHVMQWGIPRSGGWTIDDSTPASPHLVPIPLEPALQQQVQDAAATHEVSEAAWLRHAMRHGTREDFPASWRAEETAPRSRESGYFARKLMLRLDQETARSWTY